MASTLPEGVFCVRMGVLGGEKGCQLTIVVVKVVAVVLFLVLDAVLGKLEGLVVSINLLVYILELSLYRFAPTSSSSPVAVAKAAIFSLSLTGFHATEG